MAEALYIQEQGDKVDHYLSLIPQISSIIEGEPNVIANLANITAALAQQFKWLWVGFYFAEQEELVLGPFQGPIACTRIAKGQGVCGLTWQQQTAFIVPDVSKFEGHIACSSASQSEIVLPIFKQGQCIGVLDVDSEHLGHFDKIDQHYLTQICQLVEQLLQESTYPA